MSDWQRAGGTLGWLTLTSLPETLRKPVSQLERGQYNREPIETEAGSPGIRLEGIQVPDRPKQEELKTG